MKLDLQVDHCSHVQVDSSAWPAPVRALPPTSIASCATPPDEVEELEHQHAPVDPRELAERVVYAHHHLADLAAACAYRAELIATIADCVRELRASGDRS